MKKIILFLIFILCFGVFSNDWEFGSEGEHLIPLESSDSIIKKEKIIMKLTDEGMQINVRFVFESTDNKTKKIGFITPPDEQQGQLFMSNFKTMVNGKEVSSRIERFDKSPFNTEHSFKKIKQQININSENDTTGYVYYFDAPFIKGENIVEHSYIYNGSGGVYGKDYAYVITTISKWKNKRVEDFELVIDMGNNSLFVLPYTFWKNGDKINWEIIGKGKIEDIIFDFDKENKNSIVKIKNGYIRYKSKNFSPDYDISIREGSFENMFFDLLPESYGQYKYQDKFTTIYRRISDDIYQLSDDDFRIIRNYPYAVEGYDFSDPSLRKYFSQFFWYDAVGKDVVIDREKYSVKKIEAVTEVRSEIKKYLSEDLAVYSKDMQRKIRNLPYALRGYEFKEKYLLDYYKNKYNWYEPEKRINLEDIVLTLDEKELIRKLDEISK